MGYTIKQKIDICLKAEANPEMTQQELAAWAQQQYLLARPPSQTTISRILKSKNELISSKDLEFLLVRRRKMQNQLLRKILTEWISQAIWESIPITTPIVQSTANAIWTRLPSSEKEGNGVFNHKWCNHFIKKLNITLTGGPEDVMHNNLYNLNKVWKIDEKVELKLYLHELIRQHNYLPQDIFTIDEFMLFYSLPLDQIFDVSSIDKGLKQSRFSTEDALTIMLGCNIDGSERLPPLLVGQYDTFDMSASSNKYLSKLPSTISKHDLAHKITEHHQLYYKSNSNKWITSSMFQNYLLTLDHKIGSVNPSRRIVIILDDLSSHRILNLRFDHIRLCYLKNNNNHLNPFSAAYNGTKFDYLPMSFGIIEEFKILYRMQQYLEMINMQRTTNTTDLSHLRQTAAPSDQRVLSESDYQVPLIKVIEWIKRSWDSITNEKIFCCWQDTRLFSFARPWPAQDQLVATAAAELLSSLLVSSSSYDSGKSYHKLKEIMGYLNVVIPWDIDELLGLVNERGKITLSYASIEEIIGSCVLEENNSNKEVIKKPAPFDTVLENSWLEGDNLMSTSPSPAPVYQTLPPPSATATLNTLLAAAHQAHAPPKHLIEREVPESKRQHTQSEGFPTPLNQTLFAGPADPELSLLVRKLLESETIKLSPHTISELKQTLVRLQE